MTRRLTTAACEKLKPDPEKRIEVADSAAQGLRLVVQPTGHKSWAVRYRHGARWGKVTLGRFPDMSVDEARQKAVETIALKRQGKDPAAEKRRERLQQRAYQDHTVGWLIDEFITCGTDKLKPATSHEYERSLRSNVLPEWGHRPVGDIQPSEVISLLDRVEKAKGVYARNHLYSYLRRMWSWGLSKRPDVIGSSPVPKGLAEKTISRDRVLRDAELGAIWRATEEMGYPFGPFFKLLILTGQRRTEVATMRWSHIDLETGCWVIPGDLTKNGETQVLPLPESAVTILAEIIREPSVDLVFTTNGATPISGFSKAAQRLKRLSGTENWRLHDIRRWPDWPDPSKCSESFVRLGGLLGGVHAATP